MPHRVELAPSGRASCRGCKQKLGKGDLRFSLAVPNPFGEGESYHHFHLRCGALRHPEAYLEVVDRLDRDGSTDLGAEESAQDVAPRVDSAPSVDGAGSVDGADDHTERGEGGAEASVPIAETPLSTWADALREHLAAATISAEHRRLRRFVRAERASSGRAQCRHCRHAIAKGELRLALEIFDDGRANAAGFVHVSCTRAYVGSTAHIVELVSAQTDPGSVDLAQLADMLRNEPSPPASAS